MRDGEVVGWHHLFNGHELGQTQGTEKPGMLQSMEAQSQTQLGD